jgi:tetratricopeptide (TPR) repeat protein
MPFLRKTIKLIALFALTLIIISSGMIGVSAYTPYKTYSYSYTGKAEETPHFYLPDKILSGIDLGTGSLSEPSDMLVDKDLNTYIADSGNNRILRFDKDWKKTLEISSFVSEKGNDSLSDPEGLYITNNGDIYVADTKNMRIVVFDKTGKYSRTVGQPKTTLLPKDFVYRPTAIVVDKSGRIYVVARNVNLGIIQLTGGGDFEGFMGAQQVSYNPLDYLWKQLLTKAQTSQMRMFVPTEYNNIISDQDGFIYATCSAIQPSDIESEIKSPSKTPKFAPLKRLNPSGVDVLHRSAVTPIVGDLNFDNLDNSRSGPSIITDVTLGESGTYTILDANRNRYFTYTKNGNLLYAFGLYGTQQGATVSPSAICYKGSEFMALDKATGKITVYTRTDYGNKIITALDLYNHYKYDKAVSIWKEVLGYNSNFDIAYKSIGQSLVQQGSYVKAMDYFMLCRDFESYSSAFKANRNKFIVSNIIFIIILLPIIIFFYSKFSKFIKKVNTHEKYKPKWQKLLNQLTYGFHVIYHPFDGFWDLKHYKRGSIKSANILVALACFSLIIQKIITPFIFNPQGYDAPIQITVEIAQIIIPVLLWVTANWCLTTLMDGEGSFKDIYIATSYALFPIILITIPTAILSHFLTIEEGVYITFLNDIAFGWTILLVLAGCMVVHQYSLFKNIVSSILTIIGIGVLLFIGLVFITTIQRIFAVFGDVITEIMFRM